MDISYRDFLIQHSNWNESDLETLDELSLLIFGEDLSTKEQFARLWKEVTGNAQKGQKQKQWQELGSDQIIQEWALMVSEEFNNWKNSQARDEKGRFMFNLPDYLQEDVLELIAEADEILGKMIF